MSLPAPAVPCLLPSSPQPSHTHTHPLQIFFPFEITQKLLKNKATSVKILFFPQHTPMPKHSHTKTLPSKTPTAPQKHPQTYTSLKPLLKAFHLHSPHNPPSSSVLSSQSCNPAPFILNQSYNLTPIHPLSPILQSCTHPSSYNPSSQSYNTIISQSSQSYNPSSHNLTILQSSQPYNLTILTILTILQSLSYISHPHNLTIPYPTHLTTSQPHNPTILQSSPSYLGCNITLLF